jgi:hypothetical protein
MIQKLRARLSVLTKAACFAMLVALLPSGAHAAKWFYDNALGEVRADEKVQPAKPEPVQLLFEFQRDGQPNPKATKLVKPWAVEDLKATGAFSDVVETPPGNGAVLSIKFNNVVNEEELKKAKKQAFGAGLGFGMFGGVVATDHYVVTLEYIPVSGGPTFTTQVTHALYMKYGKKDVEIPGTEVKNVEAALQTVVRQALARGVNNLFTDIAHPQVVSASAGTASSAPVPASTAQ